MADIMITLEAARVNAGLKQAEAAKEMGVNRTTLWRWEKGTAVMSAQQFQQIAGLYKIPIENIILPERSS